MAKLPKRGDDELLLAWLRARAAGKSCAGIARDFGVTAGRVRVATMRVMRDDLRESGECPRVVASCYWGSAGVAS